MNDIRASAQRLVAEVTRSEKVIEVPAERGRWPLAAIWIVEDPVHPAGGRAWEARLSYNYGNGGGSYGIGPMDTRAEIIAEALRRLDKDLPREGDDWWPSTPESNRKRINKIRAAINAMRATDPKSAIDLPLFGGTAPKRARR